MTDSPASPEQSRRRKLLPIVIGGAVAVVLIGSAVAALSLGGADPAADPAAQTVVDDRSAAERADRGEARTEPSAIPTPEVMTAPPSASASPSRSPTKSKTPSKSSSTSGTSGTCGVSFYSTGQTTANGERFDPNGLTAAHKTFKFNTRVKVTNTANGKSVVVRINDRGPFVGGRCIDLARGAFVTIASESAGVITARYEVVA